MGLPTKIINRGMMERTSTTNILSPLAVGKDSDTEVLPTPEMEDAMGLTKGQLVAQDMMILGILRRDTPETSHPEATTTILATKRICKMITETPIQRLLPKSISKTFLEILEREM